MSPSKSTHTVKIEYLSQQGWGVSKILDSTCFVPGTWPGDVCEVRVDDAPSKGPQKATLISIKTPAPERITPACPHSGVHAGECGGCPWMLASYESQLHYKMQSVQYALERWKVKMPKGAIKSILPSPQTTNYRNRAQFKTDGKQIGFVSEGTHTLAPVKKCLILNERTQEILTTLHGMLPRDDWQPQGDKPFNTIDVDEDWTVDQLKLNTPRPFKQANTAQNEFIKNTLKEQLGTPNESQVILELFSGSGNLTSVLADQSRKVIAVESNPQAVQQLISLKLPQVKVIELNLFDKSSVHLLPKFAGHPHTLVLDPPRQGYKWLGETIKQLESVQTVLYVSCHIGQFAKDAAILQERGFELQLVQPIDQFPHTPHVELVAKFAVRA